MNSGAQRFPHYRRKICRSLNTNGGSGRAKTSCHRLVIGERFFCLGEGDQENP
jgi:hypothetical protein